LQFVLKIINTLLIADQQPAKSALIDVLGQLFSLIFIAILIKTTQGSLLKLSLALCISPILVLIIANIYYFKGAFSKYRPQFKKIQV